MAVPMPEKPAPTMTVWKSGTVFIDQCSSHPSAHAQALCRCRHQSMVWASTSLRMRLSDTGMLGRGFDDVGTGFRLTALVPQAVSGIGALPDGPGLSSLV